MNFLKICIPIFILFISFTYCKKYEDGPTISLRSKKERIANTWKVDKAIKNGKDTTSGFTTTTIVFTKEGTYFIANENYFSAGIYGTWDLSSDKNKILAFYKLGNDTHTDTYKIIKLKENETWVINEEQNIEYHLIPKY